MEQQIGRTINVMLVDDHKCMLWGLQKLIEGEHPRMQVVGTAHNRAQALAAASNSKPDVILLDLDLDGDCSLDFLPELRANSGAQVLIFTGNRDKTSQANAMLCGASGVIEKNQPAVTVIKAIECVYKGELWLDRATTATVFDALTKVDKHNHPEVQKIASLTPKEREVLEKVVTERGAKSPAIAEHLHMSDHTLRNHLTSIYAKLGVKNRVGLVMFAIDHKLVTPIPA
jgi:DNA-binding NarL/FixJ family response regulator